MRYVFALMFVCLSASTIEAKKSHVPPTPTWWCYMGVDENGDTTASCVREKEVCETKAASDEFKNKPNCFGQTKAVVFSITHISDGRVEHDFRPNMKVCKAVSKQMAQDSSDIVVGPCVETP